MGVGCVRLKANALCVCEAVVLKALLEVLCSGGWCLKVRVCKVA